MATGDILSVTILPEGWQAQVVFAGLTKYASFANGMGGPQLNDPDPNAVPSGAPKLTLNVTSMGFDATGAPTTVLRKVYGTIPIRQTFTPNSDQNFDNQTTDGTNLTVIFALSDNIYTKDDAGGGKSGTAVTADIMAGLISGAPVFVTVNMNLGLTLAQNKAFYSYFGNVDVPANQVVSLCGVNCTFPNAITHVTTRVICASAITTSGTYTLSAINAPATLKAGQVYGVDAGGFTFTVASDTVVATTGTSVAITSSGSYTANAWLGAKALVAPAVTTLFTQSPYTPIVIPGIQTSNVVTGGAVTNGSTYPYPPAIGNWSWAHNRVVQSGDTMRVVAFSHYGKNGKPCACVKVTATDQHAHTETVTLTSMVIDSTQGDAVPVSEYIATMSFAAMTALDVLTVNFKAYPWVGDTSSILDTTATATPGYPIGTAEPTQHAGPKTCIYDPAGTYNPYIAVVDPASGNDSTGAVSTVLATAASTPFATIAGAIGLLVGSNGLYKAAVNNLSRHDIGGSIIYLRNGNHAWMGGTPYATGATAPKTWCKIQNYPSESPVISSQSGATWWAATTGTMFKFRGISWAIGGSTIIFNSSFTAQAWFDQCTINLTYSAAMYILGFVLYTRCTIVSANVGYGGRPTTVMLSRGNTVATVAGAQYGFANGINIIGNNKITTSNHGLGVTGYNSVSLYCGALLSKVGTGAGPVTMQLSAEVASFLAPGSPIWLRTAGSPLPIVGYVPVGASIAVPLWPATVAVSVDFRPTNGAVDIAYDIPAWDGVAANQAGQGQFVGSSYSGGEYSSNAVIAYNQWKSSNYGVLMCNFFQGSGPELWGSALVQNVLESIYGTNPCLQFGADSQFLSPLDNFLIWHNTVVGNRCNGPYNTVDDKPAWRRRWSFKNNAFDGLNIKSDLFTGENVSFKNNIDITATGVQTIQVYGYNGYNTDIIAGSTLSGTHGFAATVLVAATVGIDPTPGGGTAVSVNVTGLSSTFPTGTVITGSGEAPTRVGNWAQLYGVNNEGVYNPQVQQLGAFPRAWIGLRGYQAGSSAPTWFKFRRRATANVTSFVFLGTAITSADVGTLKSVSLYTQHPSYISDHRLDGGTESFVAGSHLSISNSVTGVTQLDIVFQGPVTINATPQNVTVRVLSAPASTPIGTQLCYEFLGDIRCNTAVAGGSSPTSLSLLVPYGTMSLTDGMVLTGADGSLQVTVNNGQGITLNQTAQAVAVTTVLPQSTGTTSRTQVAGEYMFSPAALAAWGGGDYHPNFGSPLLVGSRAQLLPFDVTGSPRPAGFQISGAYVANLTTAETEVI